MQSPFLSHSGRILKAANTLNSTTSLLASSADIQLSSSTSGKAFVALFGKSFKPNNSSTPALKVNAKSDFKLQNSQLLFFNAITEDLVKRVKTLDTPQTFNQLNQPQIMTSVFGMRNLITPVIPVKINGALQILLFRSTVGINQSLGEIPELKNLKMYRIYKGKARKMKFFNVNTMVLPTDEFKY